MRDYVTATGDTRPPNDPGRRLDEIEYYRRYGKTSTTTTPKTTQTSGSNYAAVTGDVRSPNDPGRIVDEMAYNQQNAPRAYVAGTAPAKKDSPAPAPSYESVTGDVRSPNDPGRIVDEAAFFEQNAPRALVNSILNPSEVPKGMEGYVKNSVSYNKTAPTNTTTTSTAATKTEPPKTSGGTTPAKEDTKTDYEIVIGGTEPDTTPGTTIDELPPPPPPPSGGSTPSTPSEPSVQDLINQMIEAQRQNRYAQLDKSREAALASLAEQEAGISPAYYDRRNQAAAASDVGAMNFAQYMAGRGIKGSAGAMPEIYRNNALQGNIGALNRQEQAARDTIARDRTGVQSAYEADKLAIAGDLDAQGLQAYINQLNADRMFGLQEAGMMGYFDGNRTLAGQQFDLNKAIQEANATGMLNGQPTFDYQRWVADNEYRDKTFEESVRQFNDTYGLNLKEFGLEEARVEIDKKYKEGLLTQAEAQQAMEEAKFTYQKAQDEKLFDYNAEQDAIANEQAATESANQAAEAYSGYMSTAAKMKNDFYPSSDIIAWIRTLPISPEQKAQMANELGL
jgi:hypothetical protein